MSRRRILQALGLAALSASCAPRAIPAETRARRRFARVRVSPDRVIRTVVGLRPFRPSGFVVRAEKLGEKTIVHNYGHGGGGVTLSWGTAQLAVEEAAKTGEPRAAVLGAGAVGLATARLLQQRGVDVTLYAAALPPDTTSNIAGAQWMPVGVSDHARRTPAFMDQFVRAARLAHQRFQGMIGDRYGIRWLPNYMLSDRPFSPGGLISAESPIRDLIPDLRDLGRDEHPFPHAHVRRFDTMMIEPSIYLSAVLDDFRLAGGKVVVRAFEAVEAIVALPERTIVNCTGLGAKALFHDEELTPVKGQLTVLLPQAEIDYATLPDDLYMFPRRDGILLGGTHERGVWSMEPDLAAKDRIVAAHAAVFEKMRGGAAARGALCEEVTTDGGS